VPRAARVAVTVVFFASGSAYGSFVARIPALKKDLDAGEAELGLVLLGGAVGAILVLPLAAWLSVVVGSRRLTRASLLAMSVVVPLLALAPSLLAFAVTFALFGAAATALDLAMNAHAVEVEERYARPILSSFHAAWSIGGLAGAGFGGLAAAFEVSPLTQFLGVSAFLLAVLAWSARGLLPREDRGGAGGRVFGRPSAALVGLAALAFAGLLAEGAAGDWSAIYLDESVGTGEAAATAGFAAFAGTMTLGRLVGDHLTQRWGPVVLTRRAGVLASLGMAAALLVGDSFAAVAGFACLGAGLATVIPVAFRAAARRAASPGGGIAAVSTVGYFSHLLGPPAIGFLAEGVGLRAALGVVVAMTILIAVLASATRPPTGA